MRFTNKQNNQSGTVFMRNGTNSDGQDNKFVSDCKPDMNKKIINSAMNKGLNNKTYKKILLVASFMLISIFSIHAQDQLSVKGIVVSPENEPVPNVTVSVEGSQDQPAFTNEKGEFELQPPSDDVWLSVTPASVYKRKRIFLDGRSSLKIMLTPEGIYSGESEILVLSQFVESKDVVSSFSNVDVSKIHHTISPTIESYMQGRVSGLNMTKSSGQPGSSAFSLTRGVNSLNATNQPLYIVDGLIMEQPGLFNSVIDGYSYDPMASVSPMDVSNLTVLKDAVYTSAYGSKASNGLVVIETLDPSATETTFDIDLRRGLSLKPDKYIPQMNDLQHKTLAKEILYSSGMLEEVMVEEYPNLFLEEKDRRYIDYQNNNTDWQPYLFDNSSFTNFHLKVKGGDEIARYGLSFDYYDNNGILKNTSYNGYNVRFVSLVNIFTWLRMNASVSFNTNNSQLKESARISQTSPIYSALAKSPLINPYKYDPDGNETHILSDVDEFGVSNPLATINNFEAGSRNYNIISSLGLEADLSDELIFRTNFGIFYNTLKQNIFMPSNGMEMYYNDEAHNVAKASTNSFNGISSNSLLIFDKMINSSHSINSTTGLNITTNKFQYDWGLTKNAPENDQYRQLSDGIDNLREIGGNNRNWNWLSVFEKVTYAYQDKYIATGSISIDASSRIGDNALNTVTIMNQPMGIFYSAGLAWRISDEGFMNDIPWIEEIKLRTSLGRSGNDDIGESNAVNYYNTVHYRLTSGVVPGTIANDQLSYEIINQQNAGVDISLFGNRLRTTFDIFNSTIDNMLIYRPLKSYIGYDYRPENAGKMQNVGWDAYLFARIVNTSNFKWDIEANVSQANNEILEIEGDKMVTDYTSYELVNQVGTPVNSFYGYNFKGVYSTTQQAIDDGKINEKGVAYKAGDAIYEDISGPNGEPDNIINDYDKTTIGSSIPEMVGGITSTFSYKNWSLSAFVNFSTGKKVFNYLRYKNESMTGLANQSVSVLNRWQYEGHETDVPRAMWGDPVGNADFSSRWIEDASYLRLKNISLSYTIPDEFLMFKSAEFYISASNILTLSDYLGYDPEFSYSYNLSEQGIDYGTTPMPRQFLVGIKIGL
jgi:TonB-linked SusC/RagA family outer membrane protein